MSWLAPAVAVALVGLWAPAFAACVGGAPDGIVQAPEQCDDNNSIQTDDCLSDCTLPFCGDGFVHAGVEDCDGGACCSPTCQFKATDTVCRAAAGACDVDETCPGNSAACPADVKKPAGTECRAAVDVCDAAEVCDGSSPACPADAVKPNGTVCRAAATSCDAVEVCNGVSTACPPDVLKPAGSLCRPAAGLCDKEEFCDGAGNCPTDDLKLAGEVCRVSAGVCDETDVCDGASAGCLDQKKPNTVVCRPKAGQCDVEETCTGSANTCPVDRFVTAGTACDDANACTVGDACNGFGSCIGQSCVDDGNACTADSCDAMAGCLHVPVPDGLVCDDGDPCTSMDACTGGVCGGVLTAADTDADGYCDFQEDQAGCNPDDASEIPPQPASFGGKPAGRADVLLTYAAPSQRDVSPTSDRSCATVGHCGRFGTCDLMTHECVQNAAIACTSDANCVFGSRGFCTAGKIQDPCVANTDCDLPAGTCRVVVNFGADANLALGSATLNRSDNPVSGFDPATPGCSRKVDVTLDPARRVNRLRLQATGAIGKDKDVFRYR